MIRVRIGLSRSKYFDNQKQVAEFLNIKNCSKKALEARARVLSMEVEFNQKVMTEEELQALIDEENEYIDQWREGLTQEQINSI